MYMIGNEQLQGLSKENTQPATNHIYANKFDNLPRRLLDVPKTYINTGTRQILGAQQLLIRYTYALATIFKKNKNLLIFPNQFWVLVINFIIVGFVIACLYMCLYIVCSSCV